MSRKKRDRLRPLLALALVLLVFGGVFFYQESVKRRDAERIGEDVLAMRHERTISYRGQRYPLKRSFTSVLLIGTDNLQEGETPSAVNASYNNHLADFLVVLVFDHRARTVTPLQICRDTMCEVPWLSVNGMVGGTSFEQITLSHSYGSGREDSGRNTRAAVRSLLFDAPIDAYLSFTMDTVPVVNDLVGGVQVTLQNDIPALGESYVRGATLTLRGKDALRFVRYRDTGVLGSNLLRMGNHRIYLEGFTTAARSAASRDQDLALRIVKAVAEYICTNLSVDNMTTLADELCQYEILPVVTPEGEYVAGQRFSEYYVDEDSLWDCVHSVFCR